ncbi:ankyrin repeat domain-containing protein [Marivirga salinae]|uniref:Ankyrin repeat domain-containing protein n=1 Tax=Marivirga salinarum TaxID=3059078 RepID=A0AA49J8M8_9BACT|nr:ankyrin repeat domain-containing protein [Marivirga sp. BDSF4-3]WKK75678.2 ankyrin repeat domain-containing protein [Marivirga sp. BDSF4-3]
MNPQDNEFTFPNRQLLGMLTHSKASDLEAVKELIAEGGDINAKSLIDGETIFYKALDINIEEISDEVIIYLIENYQPNLNENQGDDMTPLEMAVMDNRVNLVRFMLSKGADLFMVGEEGLNIIEIAKGERTYHDIHKTGIDYNEMVELFESFEK